MTTVPLGSGAYQRLAAGVPEILLQNRWVEMAPTNQREHTMLIARPGTTPQLALDALNAGLFDGLGCMRGNYWFPGLFDDALFVVCGSNLYRIDQDPVTAVLTETLISGQVNGDAQDHPEVAWQKGIGYERLFISDGLLLQYYGGPASATATLSITGSVVPGTDMLEIGSVYFGFGTVFNTTDAGTPANPFIVNPLSDALGQLLKALNDSGDPGVDYSATITGNFNNLQQWSQDLTKTAAWANPLAMVITGGAGDPLGGFNAQSVVPAATSGIQRFRAMVSGCLFYGAVYTYSSYMKYDGLRYVRLNLTDNSLGPSEVYAEFDLVSGVIATPVAANNGGVAVNATMTYVGNGYYRCSITGSIINTGGTGIVERFIFVQTPTPGVATNSLPSWTPSGTAGVFTFGQQVSPGTDIPLYEGTVGAVNLPLVSPVNTGGPPATSMELTAETQGTGSNSITTTVTGGAALSFSSPTLVGGGINALAGVTMPNGVAASSLSQVSSYVLVGEAATQEFFWVNPGEITIDPLDFASKESSPDPILALRSVGDQAIIMGSGSTENWYATGDLDAPFAPIEGRVYQRGIIAGTACVVADAVMLVGNDGIAYEIGYQFGTGSDWGVHRISNNGIEERIRRQVRRQAGLTP